MKVCNAVVAVFRVPHAFVRADAKTRAASSRESLVKGKTYAKFPSKLKSKRNVFMSLARESIVHLRYHLDK